MTLELKKFGDLAPDPAASEPECSSTGAFTQIQHLTPRWSRDQVRQDICGSRIFTAPRLLQWRMESKVCQSTISTNARVRRFGTNDESTEVFWRIFFRCILVLFLPPEDKGSRPPSTPVSPVRLPLPQFTLGTWSSSSFGSHCLFDYLWPSDATEVVHDMRRGRIEVRMPFYGLFDVC